jgi:hypothetical protein
VIVQVGVERSYQPVADPGVFPGVVRGPEGAGAGRAVGGGQRFFLQLTQQLGSETHEAPPSSFLGRFFSSTTKPPVPFADTWVGEGWLTFGKRKYAQAAGPGCGATHVIRFEGCAQFRGGARL